MTPYRPAARRLRRTAAVAALALSALLAACGGGTSQSEPFIAQRYLALGDETSVLLPGPGGQGRKFGVNVLATPGGTALDCTQQPLWVQQVASLYGFTFAECNPTNLADLRAVMLATSGARVADVEAQVTRQVAAGGFREGDLATVLVGANDVLDLYAQFPTRSEAELLAEAARRGERAALVVNRLVELRARVIVSTIPDMGLSPFALKQKAAFTDTDRAALLSRLSTAFNDQLGVKVLLDGRFVGLVQADLLTRAIARAPFFYGISDISNGVCTVALPNCTTGTLLTIGTGAEATPANPANYLWADDTRLAYGAQLQLASLAVDRARRNPF
jgi:lysophospholipase L1-like esterase